MPKNKSSYLISLMDLPGQYQRIAREVRPAIDRVLESGRYILGPEVTKFEEQFANYCDAKYCIGTASGTDSLYLCLLVLGIGAGDEVITQANTFTATAEAIELVGAKPVFCDISPDYISMDPDSLAKKITKKTKAIIPVHMHGHPADMDPILKLAKEKKLFVIEDASQAHGALYKSKKIGSLKSDLTCFSFHPVKNLGAFGDAGAVITNNKALAEKMHMIINHGRTKHTSHMLIGFTGRLDPLQAAVLQVKLKQLDKWNKQKQTAAAYYSKHLKSKAPEIIPEKIIDQGVSAYHVYAVNAKNRNKLAEYLGSKGIETGMHYPETLHLQPAYSHLGYKKGDFPKAEYFSEHTLSLPLFPHITKQQADLVIQSVKSFFDK